MAADIACPVVRSDVSCYWKDMWRRLDAMRHLRELCDVSLFTDDGLMFMAHSAVLAASSDVLRQLLIAAQASSYGEGCSAVQVSNVTHDVLRVTLDFIYGKTPTSRIDFERLQAGAARLGLPGAYEYCSRRLTEECSGLWKELGGGSMKNSNWLENACQQITGLCQLSDNQSSDDVPATAASRLSSMCSQSDTRNQGQATLNDIYASTNTCDTMESQLNGMNFQCDRPTNLSQQIIGSDDGLHSTAPAEDLVCPFAIKKENPALENSGLPAVKQSATEKSQPVETDYVRMSEPSSFMLLTPPHDVHHANLMAQMSLDDLARVDECPHLRRIAGDDGHIPSLAAVELNSACDAELDVNNDLFDGIPLKKRHRKPLLQLNTPDEDVHCTGANFSTNKHLDACNYNAAAGVNFAVPVEQVSAAHSAAQSSVLSCTTNKICDQSDAHYVRLQHVAASVVTSPTPCSTVNSRVTRDLSSNTPIRHQPVPAICVQQGISTESMSKSINVGSVSSGSNLFSPGTMNSSVVTSIYSASDIKPVSALSSFDFTPFAISQLTGSSTASAVSSPLTLSGVDASDRLVNSCSSSVLNVFDQSPKYNHLSGGIMTGTSGGTTGSFCPETSLDISSLIAPVAASSVTKSAVSVGKTAVTISSTQYSNCNSTAFISLDDVSDVLKANGFSEKLPPIPPSNGSTVDSSNKENGVKTVTNRTNVHQSAERVCSFCQKRCKTERLVIHSSACRIEITEMDLICKAMHL